MFAVSFKEKSSLSFFMLTHVVNCKKAINSSLRQGPCNVTLLIFPSGGGVCFSISWICADLVTYFRSWDISKLDTSRGLASPPMHRGAKLRTLRPLCDWAWASLLADEGPHEGGKEPHQTRARPSLFIQLLADLSADYRHTGKPSEDQLRLPAPE